MIALTSTFWDKMLEVRVRETDPERCPTKSDIRIIASFELVILPNCVFVDSTPIV